MPDPLELKLRQLYESLGQVVICDLSRFRARSLEDKHHVGLEADFTGGRRPEDVANVVSLMLHHVGSLKDHLKTWCQANNRPFEGDQLIDSDVDVAVMHDLWNRDKHAEPRTSRSKHWPRLRDIRQSALLSTQPKAGSWVALTFDATGRPFVLGDGKGELVVTAVVEDKDGKPIGDFRTIAGRAVSAWEQALLRAGVALPPRVQGTP